MVAFSPPRKLLYDAQSVSHQNAVPYQTSDSMSLMSVLGHSSMQMCCSFVFEQQNSNRKKKNNTVLIIIENKKIKNNTLLSHSATLLCVCSILELKLLSQIQCHIFYIFVYSIFHHLSYLPH